MLTLPPAEAGSAARMLHCQYNPSSHAFPVEMHSKKCEFTLVTQTTTVTQLQRQSHDDVRQAAASRGTAGTPDHCISTMLCINPSIQAKLGSKQYQCFGAPSGVAGVVDWDEEFYDMLQNTVGGGKPKMRW